MTDLKIIGTEKEVRLAELKREEFLSKYQKNVDTGRNGRSIDFIGIHNALSSIEGKVEAHKIINITSAREATMKKKITGLSFKDQLK